MLVYDNRGRVRLILQLYGSIYRRVWIPAILVSLYTVTLHLAFWHIAEDYRPVLDHPFAAQSLAVLISFSVCFRTNIAWSRFWEACREVSFMYSKWSDAYSQLQSFISSTVKQRGSNLTEEDADALEYYRREVTHYFSLLSCMAVERLMRGDIRRMQLRREQGASWSDQVVFREHLRFHDLTGARQLCMMREIRLQDLQELSTPRPSNDGISTGGAPVRGARRRKRISRSASATMVKLEKLGHPQGIRRASVQFRRPQSAEEIHQDDWDHPLPVIGEISREELRRLKASEDRISLVISWINQTVTDAAQYLCVPAPILSRVYQEISNGALGYSQAEKLADVPFPFIFAQLLAIALLLVAFISPVAFSIITGNSSLTPLISTSTVLSFWSLNEMSKELENPFGVEANNVPLIDHHERFVQTLSEVHGTQLPSDRGQRKIKRSFTMSSGQDSPKGESPKGSPKSLETGFVARRPPGLVKTQKATNATSDSSDEEVSVDVRAQDAGAECSPDYPGRPSSHGLDGLSGVLPTAPAKEEPSPPRLISSREEPGPPPAAKPAASEGGEGECAAPHTPTSVCPPAWSRGPPDVAPMRGSHDALEVS